MPEPNPFIDNPKQRPYDCLGVSPSASFEDAKDAANRLHGQLTSEAKSYQGQDEDERQRHLDAVQNVKTALKVIKNADPDGATDDSTDSEQLSIELVDDRITVGEPATFIIREGGGDRARAAKLEYDGRTERTDPNGEVELTVRNAGEATVRATKSGSYIAAEETYDVLEVTQLDVEPVGDVTVGPTRFRVTDGGGNPVDGATVSVPGGDTATTSGGTAAVDLDTDDDLITATKRNEGDVEYLDMKRSIDVDKRTVALSLEIASDDPVRGEPVAFTVREADSGDPVPGAKVEVKEANKQDITEDDGRATLELEQETPTVGAYKSGDDSVSYSVDTCTPTIPKQQGKLVLDGPDAVTVGTTVSFTVLDASTDRLSGAKLEAVDASLGTETADASGTVSFEFDVGPETTVRLRASHETDLVDYGTDTHEVRVEERERSLAITAYPKQPTVGQPAEFVVEDETGDPVAATLKGVPCGGQTRTDPSSGRAELTFSDPIPSTVTAYTDGDDIDDEDSVTVTPQP